MTSFQSWALWAMVMILLGVGIWFVSTVGRGIKRDIAESQAQRRRWDLDMARTQRWNNKAMGRDEWFNIGKDERAQLELEEGGIRGLAN